MSPMPDLPQRISLAGQMADIFCRGIEQGLWGERLPGERVLCEKYQVSRNTLRTALAQLHREKLVKPVHGSGNRILGLPGKQACRLQSHDVGLLSPVPLERLRPTQTLWIDELRGMLSERGCRLHVFHGEQYFRSNPGPALQRLIASNPHGCWLLTLSSEAMQRWFAKNDVKCVVAGSVHAGLDLPYCDLDQRATCRHAAGVLLGLGHRRLALVISRSQLAGDLESEAGFIEGIQQSSRTGAEARIAYHDGSVSGISHALRRLRGQHPPVTALLVANAYHYLAVVSRLAHTGCRVPADVSVISRDDDLFLSYLTPPPARYTAAPRVMARSLLRAILDSLTSESTVHKGQRLMPEFLAGETIARATGVS